MEVSSQNDIPLLACLAHGRRSDEWAPRQMRMQFYTVKTYALFWTPQTDNRHKPGYIDRELYKGKQDKNELLLYERHIVLLAHLQIHQHVNCVKENRATSSLLATIVFFIFLLCFSYSCKSTRKEAWIHMSVSIRHVMLKSGRRKVGLLP